MLIKLIALTAVFSMICPCLAQVRSIDRSSKDPSGSEANGTSFSCAMSGDGTVVAFSSAASNLVTSDENSAVDVFTKKLTTGSIALISSLGGAASDGSSGLRTSTERSTDLTADGASIAFLSAATNLISSDTNGQQDVFVRTSTGSIGRSSLTQTGTQTNEDSFAPSMSADGRYVAYESTATNIATTDTNGFRDIFLFDRQSSATIHVSQGISASSDGASSDASISSDGNVVAFSSDATNLISADTNQLTDVFAFDRSNVSASTMARISQGAGGVEANGRSFFPSVSDDGRLVAFASEASNLVAGDTNGLRDVFVFDRQASTTTRVSVSTMSAEGNGASGIAAVEISGNGRFVVYSSDATNLTTSDKNGVTDVFIHDLQTQRTGRVSQAVILTSGDQPSGHPSISDDGSQVCFESLASTLMKGDSNSTLDIYTIAVGPLPAALTRGLSIEGGPTVAVEELGENTATVVLQEFPGFVASTNRALALRARRPRTTIQYRVTLQRTDSVRADIRRRIVKKNLVTFRNLPPGSYAVKYQALARRAKRTVGRSTVSPESSFNVT